MALAEIIFTPEQFKKSLETLHQMLNTSDCKVWHLHQFDSNDPSTIELYTTTTVKMVSDSITVPEEKTDSTRDKQALELLGDNTSDLQVEKDPLEVIDVTSEHCYIEYRIGYSSSFQVPVMYLRGRTAFGTGLGVEEMWTIFQNRTGVNSRTLMWEALTQMEHPHKHEPYFRIHPCKTGQLMAKMEVTEENYLLLWCSIFSNTVGLDIPLNLATLVERDGSLSFKQNNSDT